MNRKTKDQVLPSQQSDRIQDIDILRGFALFGVILVNIFYFNTPSDYFSAYYNQFHDPLNEIIFHGLTWFFSGKFYPIFSFLFGLGFSIQFMKSLQKGVNPYKFLARRLTILLFFGLAHIVFVWEEDILFIYAVFGFILLILAGRSPEFILKATLILYFIPIGFKVVGHFSHTGIAVPTTINSFDEQVRFYTLAPYGQILQQRIAIYLQKFSQLDILISELDRLAYFLLGFYVGGKNYIANFAKDKEGWLKIMLISLFVFGTGFLVDKIWLGNLDKLSNPALLLALKEIVIGIMNFFQIIFYMIGFLLILTIPRIRLFFTPLAGIGRIALTVYLAHTTFFTFLFYSFGFQLYGSLEPIQLFVFALSFFSVCVLFSLFWLTRFYYGPMEWAWRSLTYGEVLPFRKRKI